MIIKLYVEQYFRIWPKKSINQISTCDQVIRIREVNLSRKYMEKGPKLEVELYLR